MDSDDQGFICEDCQEDCDEFQLEVYRGLLRCPYCINKIKLHEHRVEATRC